MRDEQNGDGVRLTISAVIPTRNRPHDLLRAVESVVIQHRLPDELLVVDQSTSDESKQRVLNCLAASGRPIKLIYIHDVGIKGLVEAKARAVQESKGSVVSFLEDDIVLMPDYFSLMESGFLRCPGMLGCSGVVANVPDHGPVYRWFFKLFHRGIFFDPRIDFHGRCDRLTPGELVHSRYLSGGLSAYRREVLAQVSFDTVNDFFMLEDIEYSTRVVKIFGDQHFYINTAMCLDHHMSPVNRERSGLRWERKLREYICFYKKHREQPGACLHLIWLLLGLELEAVYASIGMLSPAPLVGATRGVIHGLRFRLQPL